MSKKSKVAPAGSIVVLGRPEHAGSGLQVELPERPVMSGDLPPELLAPAPGETSSSPSAIIGVVGNGGVIVHVAQAVPVSKASGSDDGRSVLVWQDDPGDPATVVRPVPDLAARPEFDFARNGKPPAPARYQPGTKEFRYWTAAEALRRGGDFWASLIPGLQWQTGKTLPVLLDQGEDFNAFYDRQALNFFHGRTRSGTVFSGESPDVVCHEMGHAVLDAVKPELWNAASLETAAFHESFADITALLSAIQLPEIRSGVLAETHGRLYTSSRLSRLAEQLGAAIRAESPQAVDADCLRNAVNSFIYSDPINLPHSAPASQLSSEPHSLSRMFTGAFFEALAGLLTARAATAGAPSPQELLETARHMAELLLQAVRAAPVVSNFFAQVAGNLVAAATEEEAAVLRAVFVRRALLSLDSSMRVVSLHGAGQPGLAATMAGAGGAGALPTVAIDGRSYGLDKPLRLESPGQSRNYEVRASAADASSLEPVSALVAARAFADDTIRRGRVHFTTEAHERPKLHSPGRFHTHRIVADTPDTLKLERICFDCGLRWN